MTKDRYLFGIIFIFYESRYEQVLHQKNLNFIDSITCICINIYICVWDTPPKTNMSIENSAWKTIFSFLKWLVLGETPPLESQTTVF